MYLCMEDGRDAAVLPTSIFEGDKVGIIVSQRHWGNSVVILEESGFAWKKGSGYAPGLTTSNHNPAISYTVLAWKPVECGTH